MCKTKLILLFFCSFLALKAWSQQPLTATYEPGLVVFKLKQPLHNMPGSRMAPAALPETIAEKISSKVGARKLVQPFSRQNSGKSKNQLLRQVSSALDGIYHLELPEGLSVEEAIGKLKQHEEIAYAEPYYLPQLLEIPNDPMLGSQTYLPVVKAPEAWAIQKGSTSITVAILDTGVDFNHPDLKDNLHYNLNDPIDGKDNDGDGYVDNYRGWDFANNDNDPTADGHNHGTRVTGVCAASTNNADGIAGTGYNTRYMPIKVFTTRSTSFRGGYEAIVYAANMGCQVINLSWGSPSNYSQYVQDIINYAVLEKNAVIVAAAGNNGKENDFFPASYDNVLSVSATENSDEKAWWSTYSRFVDITAPGWVYTTTNGGGYVSVPGTSFSCPMVAGAAALVRAQFPTLNAQQVMERLRRSSDDIYQVGNNASFINRIGTGRLNMLRALQNNVGPALRMDQFYFTNGLGSYAFHQDTISMWMDFTNYLDASGAVKVKLFSESEWATVLQDETSLGIMQTLERKNTKPQPFRIAFSKDMPALEHLYFRLEFTDALGYKDYQYFMLRSSGEYLDLQVDNLLLTIGSNGNLGYNYDYNLQGLGLRYQDAPLAHNMGLVVAQNPTAVANNIVNDLSPTIRDQDFKTLERLKLYNHPLADVDARSSFEIIVKDSVKLNMVVEQRVLGWKGNANAPAVVLEYRVINRADTAYEKLNLALFGDFNINDFFLNKAKWDASHTLGYTYDYTNSRYVGYALITEQAPVFHALDLGTREGNKAEIGMSLTRKQKWNFISKGISKTEAGLKGKGNDVAQWLGGTLPTLQPKRSQKVALVLVTAAKLDDLRLAAQQAKQQYQRYRQEIPLLASLNACADQATEVKPKAGSVYRFYSTKDAVEVAAEGENITLPPLSKDTTIYVENFDLGWPGDLQRIVIKVNKAAAEISMSATTLLLNAGLDESIYFDFSSPDVKNWQWNFGNGILSEEKAPVVAFTSPGTYEIKLSITTASGCSKTFSRSLTVLRREDPPQLTDLKVCYMEKATVSDPSGRPVNVYKDAARTQLIYSGAAWQTPQLEHAMEVYLTTGSGLVESEIKALQIAVAKAELAIQHSPDLNNLQERFVLDLQATLTTSEEVEQISWYVAQEQKGLGSAIKLLYDATAAAPKLRLLVQYKGGCVQEFFYQLPLSTSSAPEITNLNSCKGESIKVSPAAEGSYYFYADEQLQQLLYKGRAYQTPVLEKSLDLFITNMSSGLESAPVKVNVHVPPVLAAFEMPGDTLAFDIKNPVSFTSSGSPDASSWQWDFGDGYSSNKEHPTHHYKTPGTYLVTLTASSAHGCTENITKTLLLTAPEFVNKQGDMRLPVYPNPTTGLINIELPLQLAADANLHILDVSGREIMRKSIAPTNMMQISIQHYSKGMYIIRLVSGDKVWQSRIIHQ